MYGEGLFSMEEELSIGESVGREEYKFSKVQSIAADDEKRIYVLDYRENNIKICSPQYEVLQSTIFRLIGTRNRQYFRRFRGRKRRWWSITLAYY
jgi:hypothetical protein